MDNKPVAVVTGAARRVGAEIARLLHCHGYRVVIHYHRSQAEAQQLADALNALSANSAYAVSADLANLEDIRRLAHQAKNQWGQVDVLVNNASSFYQTPLEQASEEQWHDLMASNLKAPFFLAQTLLPTLKKQRGHIINISDVFAERPRLHYPIYCMAKAGNHMLTKSLALELAPEVRVNGIAPGAILWPEDEQKNSIEHPEMLQQIPLQTLGGADAIARSVLFLVRDSSYITGQIIAVDGGRSLRQ